VTTDVRELLAAFADFPDLPLAACRDRHELFDYPAQPYQDDDARRYGIRACEALCSHYPELARCRTWLAELPTDHLPHRVVVAGSWQP
jgi:hypothetical protein